MSHDNALEPDLLLKFGEVGYHPFILVRHGRAGQPGTRYVVCQTQNQAGAFVNDLLQLPDYARTRLLRGIEQALQTEIYSAADLFFSWTKADAGSPEERAYIGLSKADALPYYAGYPAFAVAPEAPPLDRAARVRMLEEIFHAYRTSKGNDALRFALIEALGFGLSRSLGALGRYAEAAAIVHAALEITPYSIHLKAARHALELKASGAEVPGRLAKFIGEDDGFLKKSVCTLPFDRFDIGPSGEVLLCCGHWLPTPIGNFVSSPVELILNSTAAQKIRRSVTDGTYAYCNHLECGLLSQGSLPARATIKSGPIHDAISRQDFTVKKVSEVLFGLDRTCNLTCPSCRTSRITEKFSESDETALAFAKKLFPLLRGAQVLHINPAGELFVSKLSRRVLEFISDENTPDLQLDIISNGVLFNEKEWNRFPGIHKRVRSVRISTDAATKGTFETLRRGGEWELFLENMRFLSRLRRT